MVTWHKSHLPNKKTLYRYSNKTDGYQTTQGSGLWYWATKHKVTSFFDYMIICSQHKPDRVVAYEMGPQVKKLRQT